MVVESPTFTHFLVKDAYEEQSFANISSKALSEKHGQDAICYMTPGSIDSPLEERRHGDSCRNGDIKGPINQNHDIRLIKEPQWVTVDECGVLPVRESKEADRNNGEYCFQENNASQQETQTNFHSCAQIDMCTSQQPTTSAESITNGTTKAGCAPRKKQVQWTDDHGKKLVHVFEYGWSDTEESSEEDEEEADTCACAIQ